MDEYQSDELAEDSDDGKKKKLHSAEKRVMLKIKTNKSAKAKFPKQRDNAETVIKLST